MVAGVMRWVDWLESKAYKMHIRVLLSKYHAYAANACEGARLKPTSINFRDLGQRENADAVLPRQNFTAPPLQVFRATHLRRCPASQFTI